MRGKTDRKAYLDKSADILCKAAYELCRDSCKKKNGPADAKGLKEICAAVKETIGISESLGKKEESAGQGFAVVMDSTAEEFAE